ncbi:MAG: histone deacetylase [Chloroflexi bacterium]|nr:histone deacetylase [Chloroflexota bacterium]
MKTAFYTDLSSEIHTLQGHPEHAGRLQAVVDRLQETSLMDRMQCVKARETTQEDFLRVHTPAYLDLLASTRNLDVPHMLGPDTYIVPESYDIARETVGGLLAVVDNVLGGDTENGLVAARPPGHHATPSSGMGFCLLSNVALGASYALAAYDDIGKIAIVDFDVHHGNGTQDVFYEDPSVLFISSHQSPLYPGTGSFKEMGRNEGRGFTLNLPVMPHTGDTGLTDIYQNVVCPALEIFQPDMLFVSAGFDAHWRDPLAQLELSVTGLTGLGQMVFDTAQELCGGHIIFVMEGGYDLEALSHSMENVAHLLLGDATVSDPIGPARREQRLSDGIVERFKEMHPLFSDS